MRRSCVSSPSTFPPRTRRTYEPLTTHPRRAPRSDPCSSVTSAREVLGAGVGLCGEAIDRLLGIGQSVVEEPDGAEFVCGDREQLLRKLEECEQRGLVVSVRTKRADGSIARHAGPLPRGWARRPEPA